MGTTYSNCQVRTDSQEAVVTALTGLLKEPAYVAPAVNGWVGVYPEGGTTNPEELAKQLSAKLAAVVFCWNVYDSDVFFYTLYENGEVRDEFNSAPNYFEGQQAEGDESEDEPIDPVQVQGKPEILLPLCIPGTMLAVIQAVLHPKSASEAAKKSIVFSPVSDDQYLFSDHQASNLAKLLGMNEQLASAGYRDIDGDDVEEPEKDEFRLIGNENLSQQYKDDKLWSMECLRNPEKLSYWLQQGANPNTRERSGQTILFRYALFPLELEVLLAAGVDVNLPSTRSPYLDPDYPEMRGHYEAGVTVLMVMVGLSETKTGRVEKAVHMLLEAGADANARSETGRTALGEALQMVDWKNHRRKMGHRVSEDEMRAAAARNLPIVEILRAAGATE